MTMVGSRCKQSNHPLYKGHFVAIVTEQKFRLVAQTSGGMRNVRQSRGGIEGRLGRRILDGIMHEQGRAGMVQYCTTMIVTTTCVYPMIMLGQDIFV